MTFSIQGKPRGPAASQVFPVSAPPVLRCLVGGAPKTQGSSRAFVVRGRAVVTAANNKALKPWRAAMHSAFDLERTRMIEADLSLSDASRAPVLEYAWGKPTVLFYGPVVVLSEFILPRLASHPKTVRGRRAAPPSTGLDLDKLCRALHDSLKTAHVYADDAQAVEIVSRKRYAALGETPGVAVEVRAVE